MSQLNSQKVIKAISPKLYQIVQEKLDQMETYLIRQATIINISQQAINIQNGLQKKYVMLQAQAVKQAIVKQIYYVDDVPQGRITLNYEIINKWREDEKQYFFTSLGNSKKMAMSYSMAA